MEKILTNILSAFYEPFAVAILMAILFTCVYKENRSVKEAVNKWVGWFRTESEFRKLFLLSFYTALVLFRTLLNRDLWRNPLSNVIGVWSLWVEKNGELRLTTEMPENLILFLPFTMLLFWWGRKRFLDQKGNLSLMRILKLSISITFFFSFSIELLQLFLRVGTWQLSDLVQNTAGGVVGGILYWIIYSFNSEGC